MATGWGEHSHSSNFGIPDSGWGELPPENSALENSGGTWGDGSNQSGGWESTPYGQPHRWITESPINWNLSDDDVDQSDEVNMQMDKDEISPEDNNSSFVQQVKLDDYNKQAKEYTKAAVEQLLSSPEYQRVHTRCQICWHVWCQQQFSQNCQECGGFAMQRSCPICGGKCGKVWTRDVELSHSHHFAHWDGECGLPQSEQMGYLQQIMMERSGSEDDLIDGIEDLNTG